MGLLVDIVQDPWPTKPSQPDVVWQQAAVPRAPTGVMIAFYLPCPVASQLVSLGATVPAEEMHTTLVFLAERADAVVRSGQAQRILDVVSSWAQSTGPLSARLNGLGVFNPGPQSRTPVTYANVDSPGLFAARHALVASLEGAGIQVNVTHGVTPHVTLAYGDLAAEMTRPDITLSLDAVTVAIGPARVDFAMERATQ